jgi:hypothetical protein
MKSKCTNSIFYVHKYTDDFKIVLCVEQDVNPLQSGPWLLVHVGHKGYNLGLFENVQMLMRETRSC